MASSRPAGRRPALGAQPRRPEAPSTPLRALASLLAPDLLPQTFFIYVTDRFRQCQPVMQVSRRTFLSGLTAVACPGLLFAKDRRLDMRIDPAGFGQARPEDIRAVVVSSADEIWKHCPNTQFDTPGFHIFHQDDTPITNFLRTDDNRIAIGLATHNNFWAQYAYQFAHEFCHALAGHSNDWRRVWRTPVYANKWLEESICETASLFSLRAMGQTWKTAAPYPNWRSFAPHLTDYAQKRLDEPKHRLPDGTAFLDWFHAHEAEVRAKATIREHNGVVASQLLPLFEAEPSGWEAMTAFNLGKRVPTKPLTEHFTEWKANARPEQRSFVEKVAAVFGVKG